MLECILQLLRYFFTALTATTVGALTGMGGGVIIKPVLDALGDYDVRSISLLSSITVFSMSAISIAGLRKNGEIEGKTAVSLALGAVCGGLAGDMLMELMVARASGNVVTVIQNTVLALLVAGVFCYMRKKDSLPRLNWKGVAVAVVTGVILGVLASFLGIGGGPFNIALLVFVLNVGTKCAASYSLAIIFFSQAAKLASTALAAEFADCDLTMLPPMVIGALYGGFLGRGLQHKLSENHVAKAFNVVQIIIILLCIWNIIRSA